MAKVTTHAFWITTGNVGGRFLSFLATIYLARVLGASNFGLISIGLSVLGYAVWISDMGLPTIGTRETAKPYEKREFSPSALFWIRFGAGIIVFLGAISILYVLPINGGQKTVIALFLISVVPQSLLLEWYYTGLRRYRDVALGKIIKSSTYLILVYFIVSVSSDVWWVPLLYLVGSTAIMIYLFFRLKNPFSLLQFNLTRQTASKVVRKSLTVGIGSSFNKVVHLLPPIVIGALISTTETGYYSAAMKAVLVGTLLDHVFVNLFLPMFTSYWSSNPERSQQIINRIFRFMLFIGVLMSIVFMVSAEWIIMLLFGSDYVSSILLLRILSWFLMATFINSVFAFGLLAINQDHAYLRSMLRGGIVGAVLITVCTAVGAPYWTALAVVVSEFLIMGFNYYEFRQHINTNILQPTIAGIIAILLSVGLFYSLPLSIFLQLPLLVVVLFIAFFILGGLKYSDLKWLIQIARR